MRRVALLTHGLEIGGGVPAVTHWLGDALTRTGNYQVDIHDLATSSRDTASRRIVAPRSWTRSSLRGAEGRHQHWGANCVELELMRYRPRRELSRALRTYDLVQVVAGGPAWAAVAARSGVPVVLQVATLASWERRSQLAATPMAMRIWRTAMTAATARVESVALQSVDAVVVENQCMFDHVRATGCRRVVKAPPGVDTTIYTPHPGGWQGNGHLLSVCRLGDPRKGLPRTIAAYAAMVEADPQAPDLMLAGRGQPEATAIDEISRQGLSARVQIRSDVDHRDLLDLYRGASVFLQTSYEEGLGVSVLEAMACGLPVVATETAGSAETVDHGATGWIVPDGPESSVPQQVALRALDLLAGNGAAMGERGRLRCHTKFSTAATLTRFTDVYDELLSRR